MSQVGNIDGFPLIQMPSSPGQRQVEWSYVSIVGKVENPYTGSQQLQSWQSAYYEATVTMPTMKRTDSAQWEAFIMQCDGMFNVFFFGDGLGINAQGSAIGQGVTKGSFQSNYQITTGGWTPDQYALFSPGDWIQVGNRLYRCMDQVSADGAGNASFAIRPQWREIPAAGTQVITNNAVGLFRMKQNTVSWSVNYDKTYRLSFGVREAI